MFYNMFFEKIYGYCKIKRWPLFASSHPHSDILKS